MRPPRADGMRCLAALLAALWVSAALPSHADSDEVNDPLERMNRGIFWFNDGLDRHVLEPVAKGWDFVMPDAVQRSLRNVYDNARFPVNFANNVLQVKPNGAASELFRFFINTTVGLAGIFDPATGLGLKAHREDFGQTLGRWGVPQGPFLMLPLFGPSNPRDGLGLVVDSAARVYPWFLPSAPEPRPFAHLAAGCTSITACFPRWTAVSTGSASPCTISTTRPASSGSAIAGSSSPKTRGK